MDKLFQNWDDEAVHRRIRGMTKTYNPSNRHETVEKTENHLWKFINIVLTTQSVIETFELCFELGG